MSVLINWEKMRNYAIALFTKYGVPVDEAEIIADSLVEADLAGISSHGIDRIPIYIERLKRGIVNSCCELEIINEYPGSLIIDAKNSMGIVAGVRSIDLTIEKARRSGSVFTTVRHSNHFGTAAFFTKRAVKENMIAIAATNAPPNMAPWGSYKPYLGTNPFSVAIPTGGIPIVLDMATSVVAKGKIILAVKTNEKIPEGWALTKDGEPTSDPQEALLGTVLPVGGAKGYSLSLIIDILSGILSGASFGPYLNNLYTDFKNPQNIGHFFMVLDISKYISIDIFLSEVNKMINDIKALPKAKGVEQIYMPGEIELNNIEKNKQTGISVSEAVIEELKKLGDQSGISYSSLF